MFFVGATGQLLTLLLTVCLPFVFFISGNKKVELAKKTQILEIQQKEVSFDVSSTESIDFIDFVFEKSISLKVKQSVGPPLKLPPRLFLLKIFSFSLNSSGNKAPPSEISFSC